MQRVLAAAAFAVLLLPCVTSGADAPAPLPATTLCGAHPPDPVAAPAPAAEILTGYGTGGFAVATHAARAQAFFDNGVQLGHAFAHKASIAAFAEAEKLDPGCAMCAWGEAWARGPTINYPIDRKTEGQLVVIADHAAAMAKDGPPLERELTQALQLRYRHGGGKGSGDFAYARAMDAIAREHPEDNELAILAADAWMIPAAQTNGRANLDKALGLLGPALARNPDDTGAIHFYIHATEMDGVPGRALLYAERLQQLAPAASHLVHMPSHTYYWVGRYQAAVRANLDAVSLDEANAKRLRTKDGVWGLTYHGHNVMFGTGAALIDGDGASALQLARPVIARAGKGGSPFGQVSAGTAYSAVGIYGDPAEVAGLPDPGAAKPYLQALWRYARGEAAARRGDARAVWAEAEKIQVDPAAFRAFEDFAPQARAMVDVARLVLEGRAGMLEHHPGEAAHAFAQAAALQESRLHDATDPPAFWYPVRRSLAAADLAAGRPADAAKEAKAALAEWAGDPMTLVVLAKAEQALGQTADADRRLAEARQQWVGKLPDLGPAGA